jgi:hypothetical protein
VDTALDKIDSRSASKETYAAVLVLLDRLGPYQVQNKKTSLHLTHGRAFLGVHPRANGLLVNIVTTAPLDSPRVRKVEQVSANRCHNEILVSSPSDIDEELMAWITQAYSLTATNAAADRHRTAADRKEAHHEDPGNGGDDHDGYLLATGTGSAS